METLQRHGAEDSAKVLDPGPAGPRFGSSVVKSMELEHGHAIKELRELVIAAGGEPSTDSGLWGAMTTAVESTARLAGDAAALKVLKKGEEIGLKSYEKAIEQLRARAGVTGRGGGAGRSRGRGTGKRQGKG